MEVEVDLMSEMLTACNKDLTYYKIVLTNKCLMEDGNMSTNQDGTPLGYGLVNLASGIMEHTSQVLPAILWQATHFEQTLKSLLNPETTGPVGVDSNDVIPMLQ